jgi:hypothetical protein
MAMKPVLILIALILVGGAALGYYLGWFTFSSHSNPSGSAITLSVDKDKIEADKNQVVDKAQDLGHEAADKIAATTQKAAN